MKTILLLLFVLLGTAIAQQESPIAPSFAACKTAAKLWDAPNVEVMAKDTTVSLTTILERTRHLIKCVDTYSEIQPEVCKIASVLEKYNAADLLRTQDFIIRHHLAKELLKEDTAGLR